MTMTYQGRSKFMPTGEEAKTRKRAWTSYALHVIVTAILSHSVGAQITPSDDAYTLTGSPSTNFGAHNTTLVESDPYPRNLCPTDSRTASLHWGKTIRFDGE
jgi:hypothetical protein